MKPEMRFKEHEGVLFRGSAPPGFPMGEKLVGGSWEPAGPSGLNAALFGRPVEAEEARELEGADSEGGAKD